MKVNIAVVGLGFGSAFVPIYLKHPSVGLVGICETDSALLARVGDEYGIADRFTSLEDVLADDRFDAVHLLTPVPLHVEQSLAILGAGRHLACAVPMATDLDDLHAVVAAVRKSGKRYMMMETAVYTREYFYAADMLARGELGGITFLRGTYYQDLEAAYPKYWWAQPPMHYATHAIAPILSLMKTRATKVSCFGSGTLKPHIQQPGENRFPLQTGIFRLAGTDAAAEVTRAWFQTGHAYTEAFSIYGDKAGFEWQQIESEEPVVFTLEEPNMDVRWRGASAARVSPPYRPDLLPPEIQEFADGGHGGSHPHLVHEFVSSIIEDRPSAIDEVVSADWCAPGICANLSSLRDGELIEVPSFDSP